MAKRVTSLPTLLKLPANVVYVASASRCPLRCARAQYNSVFTRVIVRNNHAIMLLNKHTLGLVQKSRIGSNAFLLWDVPSCGKRLCHFKLQHIVSSSEYAQKRPCGHREVSWCIASAVSFPFVSSLLVKPGSVTSNPVLLKNCCNKMLYLWVPIFDKKCCGSSHPWMHAGKRRKT